MGFWDKMAGTLESWFGLGGEGEIAIGKDVSGNLVFKDQVVSGIKTLSDLLAGGEAFNPEHLIITESGGLVYDSNGELVLKENA